MEKYNKNEFSKEKDDSNFKLKELESILYKEMPHIKFPSEWEIKLLPGDTSSPIKFLIKKPGAPNEIGVSVSNSFKPDSKDVYWDFIVLNSSDGGAFVPLQDIDSFISHVEKKFYEEIEDLENEQI